LELELAAHVGEKVDAHRVRQFVAEHDSEKMPSLRDIAYLTARYFGLKLSDLKSPLRRQPLVTARGVAMHLARQLTKLSLQQIGAFFGGRDHTTVLHGCRRTDKLLKRDRGTRQAILDLKKMLIPS
jgi:chromosomal replication initiator protein